ncbi:unknown protein [Cronobacter turicensis z3032]|uniref:Uncharacterized protein n=1 Tax=Cronobacter turicensis (strain DSM 18703 / CCUG 55852 / LMG 23827 / z3032) TaxID=693216 RepID=C9XZ38_CROTZ|nr:unknown protein [Cronobacter turicensis z3032]
MRGKKAEIKVILRKVANGINMGQRNQKKSPCVLNKMVMLLKFIVFNC